MSQNQKILVANNFISIPTTNSEIPVTQDISLVSTIVSNLAYYGFVLSMEAVQKLQSLSKDEIGAFWKDAEKAIKELTGANRKMDKFVVYKNFPKEMLNKSQAEYWFAQICMYWGVPNEYFTEKAEDREPMLEKMKLKVLALASDDAFTRIYNSLTRNPSRWSDMQSEHAKYLVDFLKVQELNVDDFAFKENGIVLAHHMVNSVVGASAAIGSAMSKRVAKQASNGASVAIADLISVKMSNATDVLRLAAAMSDGDISLRENVRFKKFKRSERKFLLSLLDGTKNLNEDCAMRANVWKKLFVALHPGDYKFENVKKAYDILYRDAFTTFNGEVDARLMNKDIAALTLLESRPGDFVRKLHHMYSVYGMDAIHSFVKVIGKLKTIQLLKLDNYVLTVNNRNKMIYPPNGNWTKAQFVDNKKKAFTTEAIDVLHKALSAELSMRLDAKFPQGVDLDLNVDNVKLQTNDQKLAAYGRGTVFKIPENMNFIRSASYWAHNSGGYNTWFDNGWNFFGANWDELFTCCWDSTGTVSQGAIFSGDPTNSKDMEGRACQMIDLNLAELKAAGVRYAVWNVLCYSKVPFDDATEVLATLQWGEEAQKGKLFEPSRAQMVFPLTGKNLTKYVAYIDVVERKLVYMDANLSGNVSAASRNGASLSEKMPAFVEYLNSLPSVADLFSHAKKGTMPVWFDDENKTIEVDGQGYVFKPLNPQNKFKQLNLSEILD